MTYVIVYLELAEYFLGKGFRVSVFDPVLLDTELVGANLTFIANTLPHLKNMLVTEADIVDSEVIVVCNSSYFKALPPSIFSGKILLDLTSRVPFDDAYQRLSLV